MARARRPEILEHVWTQWRLKSGKEIRNLFRKHVEISNEAAKLNGYPDMGAYWLRAYETPTFKEDVEELWQQIKPLYDQLHAYVRRALREHYGKELVSAKGPIPVHLLGNMWAQNWGNIMNLMTPFPEKSYVDVTAALKNQ
ncbi:unnamed protein product, partial [Cyprideis torosa]